MYKEATERAVRKSGRSRKSVDSFASIKNPWMSSLEETCGTVGHRYRKNVGVLELDRILRIDLLVNGLRGN